jgi:uncharacterized C2H2 Zn-finger protein
MVEEKEIKQGLKCPFCPCIFLTQADLQRHLDCFGSGKQDHEERYRKTHARIEHGSFGEE